jgi:hypothetical protein
MTFTLTLRLGDKLQEKYAVADDADDISGLYILFVTSDEISPIRQHIHPQKTLTCR